MQGATTATDFIGWAFETNGHIDAWRMANTMLQLPPRRLIDEGFSCPHDENRPDGGGEWS